MNKDTIYRQDAIDIVFTFLGKREIARTIQIALWILPPAQTEIIRCKDCKWFGDIGCAISIVDDSDKPTENDFCSYAERRTDDLQ